MKEFFEKLIAEQQEQINLNNQMLRDVESKIDSNEMSVDSLKIELDDENIFNPNSKMELIQSKINTLDNQTENLSEERKRITDRIDKLERTLHEIKTYYVQWREVYAVVHDKDTTAGGDRGLVKSELNSRVRLISQLIMVDPYRAIGECKQLLEYIGEEDI